MWDALQVAHEGTNDVKLARINTLTQEFDLFHMKQAEAIADMQKRFSHIINRLHTLGHITLNVVSTNKVLRCLSREWQPMVTAIKEANNLSTLDLTTLFGKLEEHEQDLMNPNKHEKHEKKEKSKDTEKKSIALKASSSKSSTKDTCDSESSDEDESPDEDMGLFVRRYNKYLRKNEIKHSDNNLVDYRRQSKHNKQDEYKKTKHRGSCYNCGKPGHYKPDCPSLKKDKAKSKPQKKQTKGRRAYIAWESDSNSSSKESSSDEEETLNLCLMAHQKKKKVVSHEKYNNVDSKFILS